jgi:hypothetical protein
LNRFGVALKPHCSQRQLLHPPTQYNNPLRQTLYYNRSWLLQRFPKLKPDLGVQVRSRGRNSQPRTEPRANDRTVQSRPRWSAPSRNAERRENQRASSWVQVCLGHRSSRFFLDGVPPKETASLKPAERRFLDAGWALC